MKHCVRLKIQNASDREDMVKALANSGYKVWIEEKEEGVFNTKYFVCFEMRLG